jgi:methionyl aminopeptidase
MAVAPSFQAKAGHPVDCDDTRAGLLKIAALYTMNPQWKQSPPLAKGLPVFLMNVTIKTPAEQDKMRAAGRLAASVLDMIEPYVQPGVSTDELDKRCHDFIVEELKSIPANLNYRGFPKTICTSVNHVVCHGIPGDKRLKSGDIINIDVTVIREGFHGDTSRMYLVGNAGILARRLTAACHEAMWRGIQQVRPGAHLGDIGHAIQTFAETNNFSVVREYCGHGIGRVYHEDPQVLHYGKPGTGLELTAGMTFTIEPMINAGRRDVRLLPDGWTVVTKDQSLSAQWEHTILVTDEGFEVLTLGASVSAPAAAAAS